MFIVRGYVFVVSLWLVFLSTNSLGSEKAELTALNLAQIEQLSNGTFRIEIDASGNLRFQGRWPSLCSKNASVTTGRDQLGLALRLFVSPSCLKTLELPAKKFRLLKAASMRSIPIKKSLLLNEPIYIASDRSETRTTLDLSVTEDMADASLSDRTTPFRKRPMESGHPSTTPSEPRDLTSEPAGAKGSLGYRRCDPKNFGTTDQRYCNDRHGLDVNADIPVTGQTKVRGTTMFDVVVPQRVTDSFSDNWGFKIEIIHNLSEGAGGNR